MPTLGVRKGQVPRFDELDEYAFQDLCRDLFDSEPEIATCSIYGTRGQRQLGIDLLARRPNDTHIEVGQCRRYAKFSPQDIRNAADDFLRHWGPYWSKQNVRRFVLFVACDLARRQQQDEVSNQARRFQALGVSFEAWSATTIRNKLRPHPSVVQSYLEPGDIWVRLICGGPILPSEGTQAGPAFPLIADLSAQLARLGDWLSGHVEARLPLMRRAYREGREAEVSAWLTELKQNHHVWRTLAPQARAKVLRLEAGLALDLDRGVLRATQLADEALAADPQDDQARVRALIAYRQGNPDRALSLITEELDVDSLNLKSALLLQLDRIPEARTVLESTVNSQLANAETFRLCALERVLTGNLDRARLEIQKALHLEPGFRHAVFLGAVIDYLGLLSPVAWRTLPEWPQPVEWTLVSRDDEGLSRLRAAADTFRRLAETAPRATPRRLLQVWHLACLLNDPARQDDAVALCRRLVKVEPTDHRLLAWALDRHLPIDLERSRRALNSLLRRKQAQPHHVLALAALHLSQGRAKRATVLLKGSRTVFARTKELRLWRLLHAQALIAHGDTRSATRVLRPIGSGRDVAQVKLLAMRREAETTGDYAPFTRYLERRYKRTKDPGVLFELCRVRAHQGSWDYVADHANELIVAYRTAEVIGLAVTATYRATRYHDALQLLDDHRASFPSQRLPGELRRLRISCYHKLGILPAAVSEAEDLARDDPSPNNLLALAETYLSKGDLKNLAAVARRLTEQELPPSTFLRLAVWVKGEDHDLARSLWRKAVQVSLEDDDVAPAIRLGYQLGLDQELPSLFRRMEELARRGRGGVTEFAADQLPSMIAQYRDRSERLERAYREGAAPIHMLAPQLHVALAQLYHGQLLENETRPDPSRQFPLYVRHGGRGNMDAVLRRKEPVRLRLDITAFLMAAHLEILSPVEAAFRPIRIPSQLVKALLWMHDSLLPHQPSQIDVHRQVLALYDMGKLKLLDLGARPSEPSPESDGLSAVAKGTGGCVLDFVQTAIACVSGRDALDSAPARTLVTSSRTVVDVLLEEGALSAAEHARVITELGQEGTSVVGLPQPSIGSRLYCRFNVPEVLAGAGVLDLVSTHFEVFVERAEIVHLNATLRAQEERNRMATWLEQLVARLRTGIDNAVYEIIPHALHEPTLPKKGRATDLPVEALCLQSLVEFEASRGDVIWIDDRFLSGYLSRDTVPIVGVCDVLKALVDRGLMSTEDYFNRLQRLRSANARFIPLETEELLYHMNRARITDGRLGETTALTVLRRYLAACILDAPHLQRAQQPSAPQPLGELPFLLAFRRVLEEVLVAVWSSLQTPIDRRRARSDWVLQNLYLDLSALRRLANLTTPEDDPLQQEALSLAGLVLLGTQIPQSIARREYYDWLLQRQMRGRWESDSRLLAAMAAPVKNTFTDIVAGLSQGGRGGAVLRVLQSFYRDLPTPLRDELERDADFVVKLGFRPEPVAEVEGLAFPASAFFEAAAKAVNGDDVELTVLDTDTRVTITPAEGAAFSFVRPGSSTRVVVANPILKVLLKSPMAREEVLRRHRHWLESYDGPIDELIARIASTDDLTLRVNEVEKWRGRSAAVYYHALRTRLATEHRLRLSDCLPPSGAGLLRHFGIPAALSSFSSPRGCEQIAKGLVRDHGVAVALRRVLGLPVPLSPAILSGVADLPSQDRRRLLVTLLKSPMSPVSRMHTLRLMATCGGAKWARAAQQMIWTELCSRHRDQQFTAFKAVLIWVADTMSSWPDARLWSSTTRLAATWAHAHALFTTLRAVGASGQWIHGVFASPSQQRVDVLFQRDADFWCDIAHPRRLERAAFLVTGLAYALEDHAAVFTPGLRDRLVNRAFRRSHLGLMPAVALLRDPTLAGNMLGAFLGADRGEQLRRLGVGQNADLLLGSSLREATVQAAARLGENEDPADWGFLFAILGDLRPYESVATKLKELIQGTDFANLGSSPVERMLALQAASSQLAHCRDPATCKRLGEQVVRIAMDLYNQQDEPTNEATSLQGESEERHRVIGLLLETAADIALAMDDKEGPKEFAAIAAEILKAWPAVRSVLLPLVARFVEELPPQHAQHFSRLYVGLRAV